MKMSESITKISTALVSAKAELTNPQKTAKNPFFNSKYAPLDAVIDHIRPILYKYRLSIYTPGRTTEQYAGAEVFILHESGEWMLFDEILLPVSKKDPQGFGAAITYAQRYAICAALGITGDADDDGNSASGLNGKGKEKQQNRKETEESQHHSHAMKLLAAAKGNKEAVLRVLGAMGYEKADEIPADKFPEVVKAIQEEIA